MLMKQTTFIELSKEKYKASLKDKLISTRQSNFKIE